MPLPNHIKQLRKRALKTAHQQPAAPKIAKVIGNIRLGWAYEAQHKSDNTDKQGVINSAQPTARRETKIVMGLISNSRHSFCINDRK